MLKQMNPIQGEGHGNQCIAGGTEIHKDLELVTCI